MRKLIWQTDPILYSLIGGSILGGALGCLITLVSSSPLPGNFITNIIGYFILAISGWVFNLISIETNSLRLFVAGLPETVKKDKLDSELILEYSESKQKKVNKYFIWIIAALLTGIIILLTGSIHFQGK